MLDVYSKNYTIWTKFIYLLVHTLIAKLKTTNHTRMMKQLVGLARYM